MTVIERLIHTPEGKLENDDPFLRVGTKVRTKDPSRRSHFNEGEVTQACLDQYETAPLWDTMVYISFTDHPTPLSDNKRNLKIVD